MSNIIQKFVPQVVNELESFLETHGINTSLYGTLKHKSIQDLFQEITSWEAHLAFDMQRQRLVRSISVLGINVFYEDKILYEAKQVFKKDGLETLRQRTRAHLSSSLSEKIHETEDMPQAIERAVKEELDIILSWNQSRFGASIIEEHTTERESKSFPWIYTLYKMFSTEIHLDESQYDEDGYTEYQIGKNTYFSWRSRQLCFEFMKKRF